jgi:outer membrane protein OmpA-like peptidoglycan-associated protein
MKKTVPLVLLALVLSFCSEEKKLLRKASTAVDNSEFDKALTYYDECIRKNDQSFFGHAGKGIVLSEYMGRHEQAIPYLEKAISNSPSDKTKPIIHGNLAKSYHFIGNYKRALQYYGKVQDDPTYAEYDQFISKRISDCKYAIAHPEVALPENQQVVNVGGPINTEAPEYTPVLAGGNMYFTSKRQDTPKEKKNGIDGKYFESVYMAKMSEGAFSNPQKVDFVLADRPAKLRSAGEAVASASPDGKSLFVYKEGKIYTSSVDDAQHKLTLADKTINFAELQNHAAVSSDGNTMLFTSEGKNGRGTDIYISTKNGEGKWSDPVALDNGVNTAYDEEAPYLNESGVLFFSSNGHPGYGGFDVYRTQKVNGVWAKPINLGQPVNSPGDDIFFTLSNNCSKGYYASARPGGKGDLDIYKVHYVITDAPQCKPEDLLTIDATPDPNDPLAYNVRLNVPEQYRNNIRSYEWSINGKPVASTKESFIHNFDKADTYRLSAKVVAWCDTCPQLIGMCREQSVDVKSNILASADNSNDKNANDKSKSGVAGKNAKGKASKGAKGSTDPNAVAGSPVAGNAGPNSTGSSNSFAENSLSAGLLSESDLKLINWNTSSAYFDYNDYNLKDETRSILGQNLEVLKSKQSLQVIIHGYADARGTPEYNKQLSAKRAEAVKKYFVSQGISSKRIKSIKAHGEDELVNNCGDNADCDENQHGQNRRVTIDVINPSKGGDITSR